MFFRVASRFILGQPLLDVRASTLCLHSITIASEPCVPLPIHIRHSFSHRLRSSGLRHWTAGVFLRTDADQVFSPRKTNACLSYALSFSEDLIDAAMDKDRTYCDLPRSASPWLQEYFHQIHLGFNHFTVRCLFTELIPTGAVLLFNTYIIYYLIRIDRGIYRDERRTMSWMNGVLLIHSTLLLGSLFAHIVGHFTVPEAHETWWVLLAILINSSLNFYLYCLSGKAFRNEILRFIDHLFCRAHPCCQDNVYSDESAPNQIRIQLRTVHCDD